MSTVRRGLTVGTFWFATALATPAWSQAPAAAGASNPIQVPSEELLAQFPRMGSFRLSPDGRHLLAIESRGDQRNILVFKTDDLSVKPTVITSTAMRIDGAAFLKNDMLSVTLTQPFDARIDTLTKTFIRKLMVTDLAGKEWKEPLAAADTARSDNAKRVAALQVPTVKSRMLDDPHELIVESDGLGLERDLFRYNVRTGQAVRSMRLSENDINVLVDGKGVARAKTRGGFDSTGLFVATDVRDAASGKWEEHFRSYVKDRDEVEIVALGSKPDLYVLRSNVGRELPALYEYDAKERKNVATLFEHRFFEALGVRSTTSAETSEAGAFDGFTYRGLHGDEVHWLEPKMAAVVNGMAQSLGIAQVPVTLMDVTSGKGAEVTTFAGAAVTITAFHEGAVPTYLIRASGLNYPTEHYLLRGQRLSLLAKEFPQLDRRALGSSRFVYYKARDGLHIPAILTTPNPSLCGNGPYSAVVHPHGGPWARDTMDFDYSGWVPLMVSRCHVVLQPQFRGSAGWGRTLWKAGDAEWGQKMQDDKDDGAKWLVDQKLVDPKRIAIFGFSYGGYAAFAASVRPDTPFKCAISGAGVSDIDRVWAAFYTNPYFRDRQEPTVRGLSPLTKASQQKIPLMVYHGDRDQTVPIIQSELFVEAARAAKRPIEYHALADYGHGPAWRRETNAQQLKLISDYLSKGCGGGGL